MLFRFLLHQPLLTHLILSHLFSLIYYRSISDCCAWRTAAKALRRLPFYQTLYFGISLGRVQFLVKLFGSCNLRSGCELPTTFRLSYFIKQLNNSLLSVIDLYESNLSQELYSNLINFN